MSKSSHDIEEVGFSDKHQHHRTTNTNTTTNNDDDENRPPPPVRTLNWLNLVFYVFNALFTFGIGNFGWVGNGDNGTLSRKYQTIVTPAGWAFSIWSVIFIFQAIFVIVQFLPRFRSSPMVITGVGYWYIIACICQVGWTFVFAYEIIWASLIFILGIWAALATIVYNQYYTESERTLREFWLLRFPFAIHCGWLTAASVLNVNLCVVRYGDSVPVELAVGIVSLAVLHAVSVVLLTVPRRPNYTLPCVLSWANGAISSELADTPTSIAERFSYDSITGVRYAAAAVAIIIILQVAVRAGFDIYTRCTKGAPVTDSARNDDDMNGTEHSALEH